MEDIFQIDLVDGKFRLLNIMGSGAYGTVYSALDQHGKLVAIKQINMIQKKEVCSLFMRRTLREVRILKFLRTKEHPNIIKLFHVFHEVSDTGILSINMVMEKMDCDLHRVIRLQTLSDDHIRYFTFQILSGLYFLHKHRIIHRDLKPSNLFVNSNCDLKIGDFGLARVESGETSPELQTSMKVHHKRKWTEYVQTRWYRAPETIMGNEYSKSVDVWSVGCIIAEMIIRTPLMQGKSTADQLVLCCDLVSSPTTTANKCKNLSNQTLKNILITKFAVNPARRKLREYIFIKYPHVVENYPQSVWDLIESMLNIKPEERITVEEAMKHEYMQSNSLNEMTSGNEGYLMGIVNVKSDDDLDDDEETIRKELICESNDGLFTGCIL